MKTKNNFKGISILQVVLLVISIFAIAWVIGSSIEVVNAVGEFCDVNDLCFEGEHCSVDVNTGQAGVCIKDEQPPADPPEEEESSGGGSEGIGFQEGIGYVSTAKTVIDLSSWAKSKGGSFLNGVFTKKGEGSVLDPKNKLIKESAKKTAKELAQEAAVKLTKEKAYDAAKKTTIKATEKLAELKASGASKEAIAAADKALGSAQLAEKAALKAYCPGCGTGTFGSVMGTFAGAAAAAFAVAYGYAFLLEAVGVSARNADALKDAALYVALATAVATTVLFEVAGGAGAIWLGSALGFAVIPGVGWVAAGIALVAMAVVTLVTHQDYSQEIFNYQVQTWQPPEGGDDCLKCNALRYGCSEYQCHSFGQACDITNKGTSDEKCVWVNKNDILPPELTPIDDALKEGYIYTPAKAVLPNERGVRISYQDNADGCIPPFTNITLGVATNEPASCKIDIERKFEFDELMSYMVEGILNVYNHTLPLPSSASMSTSALEHLNLTISNDNEYVFFIRCKDVNGNPTTSNFLMEFCVDQGPDTMAPIIEGTSFAQNSYVSYNKTEVPLEVYTNEPADCKWDFQDLDYGKMNNNMTGCSQVAGDYFRAYSYGCSTNLTGIKNEQTNNYYIKCEDQPWFETDPEKKDSRNENKQSYVLSLTGTSPLIIDEVLINDKSNNATIKDATDVIKAILKIKTLAGAEEGKARCAYEFDDNFIYFYNNGIPEFLIENTQPLWLVPGDYNYSIRCEDLGGNVDYANAIFTIEKDTSSPEITRVYREQDKLKLITHEPAQCVYSSINCNYAFEDGSGIITLDSLSHFVDWDTEVNYYIKCKDKYENQPVPQNQCSIIVRGSEYISG